MMQALRRTLTAVVLATSLAGASQAAERQSQLITLNVDRDGVARAGVEPSVPESPVPAPASAAPATGFPARGAGCDIAKSPTPSEAEVLVRKIATEEDFYPDFVVAVAKVESHLHAEQVSPKGAIGLMQLMPATAARFKVDICDPAQNVRGGVRYLRALHERYRNPMFILSAYNAGEEAVDLYRGVPPFPETVRYVASVLNEFYTWPLPGALPASARAARARASGTAPKIQTATSSGWSQDFVLHVEE